MTYDWVHNCLQDGVFTVEVQKLLIACSEFGLTKAQVKADLRDPAWQFSAQTRTKAKQLHRIFDPYRDASMDPNKIKCSASELLGLYDILRYIVAAKLPRGVPELQPKVMSFDAACNVLDIIVSAKRGCIQVDQAATALEQALSLHMALHIAAYGTGGIKPKHHWNFDLPGQIRRDRIVIDMFIIERLHLKIKSIAEPVKNTSQFERSVMAGVVNVSLKPTAENNCWSHALLGTRREIGDDMHEAKKMRVYGLLIEDGDVVFNGDKCGIVQACLLVSGVLHAVVENLSQQGNHTIHWGLWRPSSTYEVWVAAPLTQSVAWRPADDGATLVLR
jgi:hypothetical protein